MMMLNADLIVNVIAIVDIGTVSIVPLDFSIMVILWHNIYANSLRLLTSIPTEYFS